jgi:hypothetical protein
VKVDLFKRWQVALGALTLLAGCAAGDDLGGGGAGNAGAAGSPGGAGGATTGGGTGGGTPTGGTGTGAAPATGGAAPVAFCESDAECFEDPPDRTLWARCVTTACWCYQGAVNDPETGKCRLLPGSYRIDPPDVVVELDAAGSDDEGGLLMGATRYEGDHFVNRLLLQRIGATGSRIGELVELWKESEPGQLDDLALATDGERYLHCVSSQQTIRCGFFDPSDGALPPFFEVEGKSVAVAYTQDTWLVAHRTATSSSLEPAEFVLQTFSRDGEVLGTSRTLRVADASGSYGPEPLLTATDSLFVLVAPNAEAEYREHVYWLNPTLVERRSPADVGWEFAYYGAVAATDELVAVSLSKPYASVLSLVGTSGRVETHSVLGGGKLGVFQALSAMPSSIVASWFLPDMRAGLFVQEFASLADEPREGESGEWNWVSFRIGNRLFGARGIAVLGWPAPVVEIAPIPESR